MKTIRVFNLDEMRSQWSNRTEETEYAEALKRENQSCGNCE